MATSNADHSVKYHKLIVIVLVDDLITRIGLKAVLSVPDIEVVETSSFIPTCPSLVKSHNTDVVVAYDTRDGSYNEFVSIIGNIKDNNPKTKCIVISNFPTLRKFLALLEVGIDAFVSPPTSELEVLPLDQIVRIVATGYRLYDGKMVTGMVPFVYQQEIPREKGDPEFRGEALLTPREKDVLRLAAQGSTNDSIGLALHISPNTVKAHIHNICDKLNVNTRNAAVKVAEFKGII